MTLSLKERKKKEEKGDSQLGGGGKESCKIKIRKKKGKDRESEIKQHLISRQNPFRTIVILVNVSESIIFLEKGLIEAKRAAESYVASASSAAAAAAARCSLPLFHSRNLFQYYIRAQTRYTRGHEHEQPVSRSTFITTEM